MGPLRSARDLGSKVDLGCPHCLQAALHPSAPWGSVDLGCHPHRQPRAPPLLGVGASSDPRHSAGRSPTRSSVQRPLTRVSSVSALGFVSPQGTKRGAPPMVLSGGRQEPLHQVLGPARPKGLEGEGLLPAAESGEAVLRATLPRRPRKQPQAGVRAAPPLLLASLCPGRTVLPTPCLSDSVSLP